MSTQAPWPVGPGNPTGIKNALWYSVDVPYSDGEERHWPGKPQYRPSSDNTYRFKLGTAWAEKEGFTNFQKGNYYLSALPKGYATFEMEKPGGSKVYKRLFGHPNGRFYDSVAKYEIHFLWLMSGMEDSCDCLLCSKGKAKATMPRATKPKTLDLTERPRRSRERRISMDNDSSRSSSASGWITLAGVRERRQPKQPREVYAIDEESTPDVYKEYVRKLHHARESRKGIEDDVDEKDSFDWRAERKSLPIHLTQIEQQHSFIPRLGELVLWCSYFPANHYLILDQVAGEYKFYSFEHGCYRGFPDWRGGVISAVPASSASEGPVDFNDILEDSEKKKSLNSSGFRVETLPDPNSVDKSLSKQYHYVTLRHIRPLSHWQLLIRGIPKQKLHPSLYNALTCMTSVSLLEKFWFTGSWPEASIKCKGIYLGSELIIVGDTVRIAAENLSKWQSSTMKSQCTDLMVVSDIRLNLEDIKPDHIFPQSPYLSSRSTITLVGSAYTLDARRDYRLPSQTDLDNPLFTTLVLPRPVHHERVKSLFRPTGTGDYGSWYPLHAENKRYEVSFDRVLGRLYEADAVRLWTGLPYVRTPDGISGIPKLDFDVPGIKSGRKYATQTDERIPETSEADQMLWNWADTRALGLALESFNGLEVGPYHEIRDQSTLRAWRAMLKIIDGGSLDTYGEDTRLMEARRRWSKPGSRITEGKAFDPDEDLDADDEVDASQNRKILANSQSAMASAALSQPIELSSDEDPMSMGDEDEVGMDEGAGGLTGEAKRLPSHSLIPVVHKAPRTKHQIMSSIETGPDELDYDEEDAFLYEPLPLARGGTEESEGGDYDPAAEESQRRSTERLLKRTRHARTEER